MQLPPPQHTVNLVGSFLIMLIKKHWKKKNVQKKKSKANGTITAIIRHKIVVHEI